MSFKCALLVRKRGPILYIAILLGAHCYGKHIRIELFIYNAYTVKKRNSFCTFAGYCLTNGG
jgi:hypothetical protein